MPAPCCNTNGCQTCNICNSCNASCQGTDSCQGCNTCQKCNTGCQITCNTCQKCNTGCQVDCNTAQTYNASGTTLSSLMGAFSWSYRPVSNTGIMGPGYFDQEVWDELANWLSQRNNLPTSTPIPIPKGGGGTSNGNGGSIVATSSLNAVCPFSASEFNRLSNLINGPTASSNQIITAQIFLDLESAANNYVIEGNACKYCNTACDNDCNVCQKCDAACDGDPGDCLTCQSCDSGCNVICNGCQSCNYCNSCNMSCQGCNSCQSNNTITS